MSADAGTGLRRPWLNRVALPVAVLVIYFLSPVSEDAPIGFVAGIVASLAGLALVAWVTVDELRRAEKRLQLVHLALILEVALVSFASVYFLLAVSDPGQFTGLATRLDALYLSMATVSTVGFGDVSATGQAARAVVTVQMAFNLAFVASLVSLFQARLQQNRARRREDGGDHTA